MTPPRPRVLLVDDDASIRRFVALALEDVPVELDACGSVAQALDSLRRRGPAALVITDLMMPGENGLGLLQRLADDPALRGAARIAVFSAGLQGPLKRELARHEVWRQLSKPVSVDELEACVRDALPRALDHPGSDARAAPAPQAGDALDASSLAAVTTHFAGDQALFLAFQQGAVAQFALDLARGDASLRRGDLADVRHLAHSLKSVLTLLGHAHLATIARALEDSAHRNAGEEAGAHWASLRGGLSLLARSG